MVGRSIGLAETSAGATGVKGWVSLCAGSPPDSWQTTGPVRPAPSSAKKTGLASRWTTPTPSRPRWPVCASRRGSRWPATRWALRDRAPEGNSAWTARSVASCTIRSFFLQGRRCPTPRTPTSPSRASWPSRGRLRDLARLPGHRASQLRLPIRDPDTAGAYRKQRAARRRGAPEHGRHRVARRGALGWPAAGRDQR
jgi:hypothetical protein